MKTIRGAATYRLFGELSAIKRKLLGRHFWKTSDYVGTAGEVIAETNK